MIVWFFGLGIVKPLIHFLYAINDTLQREIIASCNGFLSPAFMLFIKLLKMCFFSCQNLHISYILCNFVDAFRKVYICKLKPNTKLLLFDLFSKEKGLYCKIWELPQNLR